MPPPFHASHVDEFDPSRPESGRERALIALRESETRMRAILNATVDAIVTIDKAGIILAINPATERMFGYEESELLGQNVKIFMPFPHRDEHDGYLARYKETGEAHVIGIGREVRGRRKDGTTFPLELAVSEVESFNMYSGIMRDISERRILDRQVVKAVMEERHRTACDLHDGIGSMLTAIHLRSAMLAKGLAAEHSAQAEEGATISSLIKAALSQVRSVARGLHTVGDEPENLLNGLQELVRQASATSLMTCELKCSPTMRVHDPMVANQIYRIAQEAIANATKYSGGSAISVSLEGAREGIVLTIADDGKGIDLAGDSGGLGLAIMKYRAHILGGTIHFSRPVEGGTTVTCKVPVSVQEISH